MAKKERIEDLGVLFSKLGQLSDHELFDSFENFGVRRPKDFLDVFAEKSKDEQLDFLYDIAYQVFGLHEDIIECWAIAKGDEE